MYSLEQVIYFLEQRQQTEDWNIRDAAIAYLKGYREVLPEYAQMKLDAVKNDALTWDELKQMFHRPVWIETTAKKGWNIIISIDSADMHVIHTAHRGPKLSGFSKADLGKTWNAYRKERV